MKIEKKQCTNCRQPLSLECFRISKRTAQSIKCCIKCLDIWKKSRQQTKCKHGRQRPRCKDCGGSQICEHNKQRPQFKDCGSSQICEHNKQKSKCKDCGESEVCEHNKRRSHCPLCDPLEHLTGVVRCRIYTALKSDKEMSSTEYLGCNIETLKQHIEQQFTEGMSWENYGEWHIDHKILLKYNKPSLEEVAKRLHYTNTEPMWASENMSKGCRYISG